MARRVVCSRALRSKILFKEGPPNTVRSFLLARTSSHSVAGVQRTNPLDSDQTAARCSRSTESTSLPGFKLSFNDAKNAFQSKTSWEIVRALAVFRLCSFDFLVNRNREVSKPSQNIVVLGFSLRNNLCHASPCRTSNEGHNLGVT